MENATKALGIAASVLISILILGIIVYTYNNLSDLKRTQEDVLEQSQAVDFNKRFEVYNKKNLYGSELFSLANMMDDYNQREVENKGYQKIELEVTINTLSNAQVFTSSTYGAENLTNCYENLAQKIKSENEMTYKNKNLSYWAASTSELKVNFNDETNPTLKEMKDKIKEYTKLVSEQTDMARKTFKCTNVKYDKNNGRITEMTFEDI